MMQKKNPALLNLLHDAQYEVEQILSRKNTKNGLKYLIKWKGFQIDQCTWEPLNHLYNSMEVVQSYERKLMEKRQKKEGESALQKNNKQNISNQKEQSFQENLIFPRIKDIKFQSKEQSVEVQNKKRKKITKKHNKHKKTLKRKEKEGKGQQFYILIDEDQSSVQQEKLGIREQGKKQEGKQEQKQNQEKKIEDLLQLSQFNIQVGDNQRENEMKILNDFDDQYELIPSLSLNLTQMQQEEGNRLTLQNLNPYFHEQLNGQKQYDRRKICRLSSSAAKNIKILQGKDPILKNKELCINKIINLEGKWLVEVKLGGKIYGFAYFETLKKFNLMKVLDFLVELIPKQ